MGTFKEALKVISLLIFCFGIPVIAWDLTRLARGEPNGAGPNPTYAEMVGIVLAAVTVVLGALAIVVAILAVWGYKSIKDEAGSIARRAVDTKVDEAVKRHVTDEALKKHVRREIRHRLDESRMSHMYADAFDVPGDAQHGSIAADYPKEEGRSDDKR